MYRRPILSRAAATALALGKNGSYGNEGNVLEHVLYDTSVFQNTTLAPETQFFTQPIGAAFGGGIKGRHETNMQEPSRLPTGQTMLVMAISIALKPILVGADVDQNTIFSAYANIMQFSYWRLIIAGREYDLEVPGSIFIPPVFGNALNSAANSATSPGEFISSGWVKLTKIPIPIGPQVSFHVSHFAGSAVAANKTILDTASDVLNTQLAEYQVRLKGIFTRSQ